MLLLFRPLYYIDERNMQMFKERVVMCTLKLGQLQLTGLGLLQARLNIGGADGEYISYQQDIRLGLHAFCLQKVLSLG